MLAGRRILLGVTGGSPLTRPPIWRRLLVQAGATVRTVLTESALRFLGPHTMAGITGTPPATGFWMSPPPPRT